MTAGASLIDFARVHPEARALDVRWIHGSPSAKHNTDDDIQVHAYDEHTVILRQNMAVHCEAPFLYMLFGNARAVLIDTGATAYAEFFPLRRVVDDLVEDWLARHPRPDYELLVVHTHTHTDHIAADAQFADRPATTVVDAELTSAWNYFRFTENPDATRPLDLGGRILECLATPGHDDAAVTFYDPWTGILLTGDTVYPGRLYIRDWAAFGRTIDRMIALCDRRPITHILGCHIEMSTEPGKDYPIGATYQPDELPLQMTPDDLRDIRAALDEIGDSPARRAFPRFVLYPIR
ncbi:MBL fold metallo-hydrolase [Nocardia crassostreae]|uniref:MBL fold metallo-hydrolase n=1 Tax=Nocardia crassostreae TaxID=53428 RepID=UPI0008359235|nr:MBL fold metallo-hydrolase [Nocardia crassostreae]